MSARLDGLLRQLSRQPETELLGHFNSYGTRQWQFHQAAAFVVVTATYGGTPCVVHEPDFVRYSDGTDSPAWAVPPNRPDKPWRVSCQVMDDVI